jgi:hypothetical protein
VATLESTQIEALFDRMFGSHARLSAPGENWTTCAG